MRYILRISGIIFLLALLTTPLVAQDAAIIVVGSGIVQPAFEALAEASGAEVSLSTSVTGTSSGFSQFCGNTADITTATRAISAEENSLCSANNITYFQVALGQEIAALIVNPEADFAVCVTDEQINQIFTPSAQGSVTNWTQVLPEASDIPLSVAAPTDDTSTYAILDQVVEGDGIRGDATLLSSADEIIAQVSENVGAIGVVKLADAVAAGEAVRILDLDAAEVAGCRTPNADNVENNLYPLADRLYAYVNVASLNKPGVTELLEYISSDAAVSVIEAQGIAAPTANALQENRDTLQAAITGEPIVAPVEDFIAPTGIAGTVNVGGAGIGFGFLQSTTTVFNTTNPDITINTNVDGEPAGFRQLCNGQVDIVVAYRDLNDEERSNCEATNIPTLTINLGKQAAVLLSNAGNDYLACLTTEQIVTAWQASTAGSVQQWNEVSESFPETDLTLFAPDKGSSETDLLLNASSGNGSLVYREDAFFETDPLYRAAATANVDGGLAVLSWPEYQSVLDNNQANVQLVGVDGGSGCVSPSVRTIADGTYPINRQAQLIVNADSLVKPEVQAFIWFVVSNENYTTLETAGFVGVGFGDLPAVRSTLQQAFADAQTRAIAAEATAEATLDATTEVTSDATVEATQDSTAEATLDATAEATAEAGS